MKVKGGALFNKKNIEANTTNTILISLHYFKNL